MSFGLTPYCSSNESYTDNGRNTTQPVFPAKSQCDSIPMVSDMIVKQNPV